MGLLRASWIILKKDLRVELRSREILTTMVLFSLLVIVIFAFAFTVERDLTQALAPGILWVTLIFAGNLGVARAFAKERDAGAMQGLMLSPGGPVAVYCAKAAGIFLFILVMELLAVPLTLMFVQIDLPAEGIGQLVLAMTLGSLGFALVGTLFGAMLADARLRELLVPLIVYPIVVPVVIAGVKLTAAALGQALATGEDPAAAASDWLVLMGGFDLVFAGLCPWVFGRVMVS